MSIVIKDGAGNGKAAKVDTNNRLRTASLTTVKSEESANTADRYNINTGDITLTNATETSVLYIKNNEDKDLVVTTFIYNLGASTLGSGDVKIDIIRNPTAGDIVTNANNVLVGTGVSSNQNFGSNKSLAIDAYKGASGETTFTDGAVSVSTRSASNTGRIVIALGAIVLPKGSSVGINYTPPSLNTSQVVQFAAACYLQSDEITGN